MNCKSRGAAFFEELEVFMAIITVSRQFCSFGDEISSLVAKKLNYKFIGKDDIEKRIITLGFPKEKLKNYDEKIPKFFDSLAKERDEYLDYLQTAILEAAGDNNCVIVGRGSFVILSELQNHLSFRLITPECERISRARSQFGCGEKQARKLILSEDKKKAGFHKCFFNYQIENPELYHAVINTALFDIDSAAELICHAVTSSVTPEKEKEGMQRVEELFICQRIVNMLILNYNLNINFLRATVKNGKVTLHGVTDSSAMVSRALVITKAELPEWKVVSAINVVQDFKAYQ